MEMVRCVNMPGKKSQRVFFSFCSCDIFLKIYLYIDDEEIWPFVFFCYLI